MPENNGKRNPEETNKYQKHIPYSYGYKLVCVDDKFSKSFKTYLGENAVYNFINNMIKEGEYGSDVMRKHFNKVLVMTKEDNEDFKNTTVCDNDYIDNDVKVRYHCHIIGKYRGSAHKDYNINLILNHYDSHLIMQELGKFSLKGQVIPNGLEKYMSFTINNKLSVIDSFEFLSSSFDSLVKNLNKDDFKYLSQEFDNNVLDLVKQKGLHPYEYMTDFEEFKELTDKEELYSSLTGRKISDKEYEHVLNVWKKFEMKTMKDYHDLHLK